MEVPLDVLKIIQITKSKWNADADEWNQWHDLGLDEKLDLITEELRDDVHKTLIELWDAEL